MTSLRRTVNTVIGVILTAIMLFPLYWMINVSLTQPTELRKDPPNLFPFNPTFDGYQTVLSEQLPYLGTSLIIGEGSREREADGRSSPRRRGPLRLGCGVRRCREDLGTRTL